jgi:hypothetical protein
MSKIFISEYDRIGRDHNGVSMAVGAEPARDEQVHTFTTTAVASDAFGEYTKFVRIVTDADAHIVFGVGPTATTNSKFISAGAPEYFGVTPGHKISVIED